MTTGRPADAGAEALIRPAVPDDDAVLADITARAYLQGGHLDHGHDYLRTLRDTAQRREQATLLVAEIDGAPVGSVTVTAPAGALSEYAGDGEWEIRMLAVDPDVAGRGIGSSLLTQAIERSRSAGARRIVLHTADSMTTAHRIYRRFGFVPEPDRDDEVVPGLWLRAFALEL